MTMTQIYFCPFVKLRRPLFNIQHKEKNPVQSRRSTIQIWRAAQTQGSLTGTQTPPGVIYPNNPRWLLATYYPAPTYVIYTLTTSQFTRFPLGAYGTSATSSRPQLGQVFTAWLTAMVWVTLGIWNGIMRSLYSCSHQDIKRESQACWRGWQEDGSRVEMEEGDRVIFGIDVKKKSGIFKQLKHV